MTYAVHKVRAIGRRLPVDVRRLPVQPVLVQQLGLDRLGVRQQLKDAGTEDLRELTAGCSVYFALSIG